MIDTCTAAIVPWIAAGISLAALLISTLYNWKTVTTRRSEYCYESAQKIIVDLDEKIFSKYAVNSWLSTSQQRLEPILKNMRLRFLTLHKLVEGVSDEYLKAALEADRPQVAYNLKLLIKSLSNEKNENVTYELSPEGLEAFACMVRFIYAPSIELALSKYKFSPGEQEEGVKDLIDPPNGTKLTEAFIKPAFEYKWK